MANKSWKFADVSSSLMGVAKQPECCWSVKRGRKAWDAGGSAAMGDAEKRNDCRESKDTPVKKEDNGRDWGRGRAIDNERGWQGFDGAHWLFTALLQSAAVRPQSEHDPLVWDGDRLGSPRYIDSQAHSFGRIRMDETCLKPRFIYLFIWCLLWPRPHLSENTGLPTGAQQLQMSRHDN